MYDVHKGGLSLTNIRLFYEGLFLDNPLLSSLLKRTRF
jgi:hypothetical protein